jgi:hypothetical protein
MTFPKFSQQQIKLALSGSAGVYVLLGGLLLVFGTLHVLDSIPLLSELLQCLGLVYAYNNRSTLFKKAKAALAPVSEAAAAAILPESTTK